MRSIGSAVVALSIAVFGPVAAVAQPAGASGPRTERASVGNHEQQASGRSFMFSVSGNGRYVVFDSSAANLVRGDTNGAEDVFLRDRRTQTTRRVSVSSSGKQGDLSSSNPSISDDGRWITFVSDATNLVPNDTNEFSDLFLRDVWTGTTRRIAHLEPSGGQDRPLWNGTISADGRSVVLSARDPLLPQDTNDHDDIYVIDLPSETISMITPPEADDASYGQVVSATGRYVTFGSWATNLVSGDTNSTFDVFLHDRTAGTTVRVSLTGDGQQIAGHSGGPAVSADGRYVIFTSEDPDIVPGDTHPGPDVFLRDLRSGTTTMVSVTSAGTPGNDNSSSADISPDGRYVVFGSWATDLVAQDTNAWYDVFVRDLRTGRTSLVSVSTAGTQGNLGGENGNISTDGRHVAFNSSSSDLVPGDTTDNVDVFVRDF
jgi:Tol biopolymer transport system component